MKKLIIFGNGKQAKCTCKMFEWEGVEVFGFCVDDEYFNECSFLNKPVYKFSDFVKTCSPQEFIMFLPLSSMDRCRFRKDKFLQFKSLGYEFYSFISKRANAYDERHNIGQNVYVGVMSGLQPDSVIGDNVYVADYAIVGHDAQIRSHCFIASGAIIGASSILEERVMIGIGAILREGTHIAEGTIIGLGVKVHRDIEKTGVYAFSPLDEKHYGRQHNKE